MTSPQVPAARRVLLRDFAREVFSVAPWAAIRACVLTIGVGAASAATAVLLVPLVAALGLDAGSGGRQISRVFAALLAIVGARPTVGWALTLLVAATATQAVLTRLERRAEDAVEIAVLRTWRRRLFDGLCGVDWAFYSRYRTSDLVAVLVDEIDRVGFAARTVLALASSAAVTAGYLAVAFRVSAPLTAVAVLAALVVVACLAVWRRRAHRLGTRQVEDTKALYGVLAESLGAMKTVRAYGREDLQLSRFTDAIDRAQTTYRELAASLSGSRQVFEIGSVVTFGVIAYVALVVRGMPPAELFVLLFVFARVAPQISGLHSQYQRVLSELPAFARVRSLDAESVRHADRAAREGQPSPFAREVQLENVSFSYGETPVLQHVDLRVRRGETVAVVGPSGAGKTTIADLMLGLLAPTSGRLLVDGKPLTADHVGGWRRTLGYVAQDGVLFHDTIRANLTWAAPSATDRELQVALESAAAWSFVSNLPRGLDTIVGDRGILLSGGERQRLALARALLRQPQLLVLDEATSSLDSENERIIERAIEDLHGRASILLITHRLSTVRRADVIYVLDAGRLVESGTWADLGARPGRFRALCEAQGLGAEAIDARAASRPGALTGV
jgi:ATP-binding cassette subfamily C protein